jgi:hypothetical protein
MDFETIELLNKLKESKVRHRDNFLKIIDSVCIFNIIKYEMKI